jgi:outer membrane lipoprotein-sorting protein
MQHPENQATVDYPHEVQFSDYRLVNGVLAPFSITEKNSHQRTSTVQIDHMTFNQGLQDSDFQ